MISRYASENQLTISNWYEEVESAAGNRRKLFREIIQLLRKRRSVGLIMHKVDRGVRNIRDWADIGDLIDAGVDIRFAHDNIDLDTRGGRLTADIQAVIAADYIRNLREEVRKGISGRLAQGLYPFKAPRGYLDLGRGKVKRPDPVFAPLVVEAFRKYATNGYTLKHLADEMAILGLTNPKGGTLTPETLSKMLRCRFYVGEYWVKGIMYQGRHQPLVSRELFNSVQRLLQKRKNGRAHRLTFLYRLRLKCKTCNYHLIGEIIKGKYTYYRCHTCRGKCYREERIEELGASNDAPFVIEAPIRPVLPAYSKFESSLPSFP